MRVPSHTPGSVSSRGPAPAPPEVERPVTAPRRLALRSVLRRTGLGLVLATLLIGPFPQGLFFPVQYRTAVLAATLGFFLWAAGAWLTRGQLPAGPPAAVRPAAPHRARLSAVEVSGLSLLALYLLASFVAVYPQGHLDATLQFAAALMAFYVVRGEVARRPALAPALGGFLVASGVAVALVSVSPYTRPPAADPDTQAILALVGGDGRLGGTFQYWNTAAIYFEALALLAAGLAVQARRPALALPAAAAASYVIGLAFVLAASRGAVLVLPVALALLLAGLPAGRRLPALLLFLGPLLAAAATARGFMANGALGDWLRASKWFATGLMGSLAGGIALAGLLALPPRFRRWLFGVATASTTLMAVGFTASAGGPSELTRRYLPQHAVRLLDMNWRTPNAVIRLIYDRDALLILRDRPWLGGGGRAWERLYHQYQSFWYAASETHNHFLQTATETGVPGLLAALAFWPALAWVGWKARGAASPPQAPAVAPAAPAYAAAWPLTAAALAIGVHSAIDFNMSFLSILLLVWSLSGAIVGLGVPAVPGDPPRPARQSRRIVLGTLGLAAGVALLAFTGTQALSALDLNRGWAALRAGDTARAETLFQRAARLAPLDPDPHAGLAEAHAGTPREAEDLARAAALDPYWFRWPYLRARALLAQQDLARAAEAAEEAVRLAPALDTHYDTALIALTEAAIQTALAGDRASGEAFARRATALAEQMLRRRELSAPNRHLWSRAQPAISPTFSLRYGQALALTGRPDEAIPYLRQAARTQAQRIQAEVWLYLSLCETGQSREAEALENRPWIWAIDQNPVRQLFGTGKSS